MAVAFGKNTVPVTVPALTSILRKALNNKHLANVGGGYKTYLLHRPKTT